MSEPPGTPVYESKQTAWWTFAIAIVLGVIGLGLAIGYGLAGGFDALIGVFLLLLALFVSNFGTLTVHVTNSEVRWFFGRGLIGKSIPLERIRDVEVHRSPWYWGWGIRWTPRGWLWRSNGLVAVWLQLSNGKQIGVGSDDPQSLESAIRVLLDPRVPRKTRP